jgi:hypothetical protein
MVKSVNHTVPRKLQAKIHSEKSKDFSVWNSLKGEVDAKYESATNLDDYGNHLIREFNRKISNYVKFEPNFNDLYITPYDAGFRFLGSTFQGGGGNNGGPFYTETTAYNSANAVVLTEASNVIPFQWAYNQDQITSINFKSTLTTISAGAFAECGGLTSITIPNSVTSIEEDAFFQTSITSLVIGSGVLSIGQGAFRGCVGLTSLTIPNNVTSLGSRAFQGCAGLTSLTIGSGLTSIGDYMFAGCTSLASVVIPNNVTSMASYAFASCSSLTSVTIGNSVTSIGDYSFQHCTILNSVTIGNSVTSIGNHAFQYCSDLTSLTIPISTTSIGGYAFYQCNDLSNFNCYAARTIFSSAYYCLLGTSYPFTIHAKSGDTSWIAGSDTIGGNPVTVIKDL